MPAYDVIISGRGIAGWVNDNLELKELANHFTDDQLAVLQKCVNIRIMENIEFKSGFLRSLLGLAQIGGQQKIMEFLSIFTSSFFLT